MRTFDRPQQLPWSYLHSQHIETHICVDLRVLEKRLLFGHQPGQHYHQWPIRGVFESKMYYIKKIVSNAEIV